MSPGTTRSSRSSRAGSRAAFARLRRTTAGPWPHQHRVWRSRTRQRSSAARPPRASAGGARARSRSSVRKACFCCGSSTSSCADPLKPLLGAHRQGRALNADPQGAGDEAQIEHQGQRQRHPQQMLPGCAARRRCGERHDLKLSPKSRRKPVPGSNSSGMRLLSLEAPGWLSASEVSLPIEKPSQLATAIAAARLPHCAKPCKTRRCRGRGAKAMTRSRSRDAVRHERAGSCNDAVRARPGVSPRPPASACAAATSAAAAGRRREVPQHDLVHPHREARRQSRRGRESAQPRPQAHRSCTSARHSARSDNEAGPSSRFSSVWLIANVLLPYLRRRHRRHPRNLMVRRA